MREIMDSKFRFNFTYFFVALLGIMFIQNFMQNSVTTSVSYNEFNDLLEEGKIKEVIISNEIMKGILYENITDDNRKIVITNRVPLEIANHLD